MNRADAKKIAETVSNAVLKVMFENVKNSITDWKRVSTINKGISKGVAWNILASNFDVEANYNNLVKINMIREFGEFLPEHLKPVKKPKPVPSYVIHQEPKFN